MILKKECLLHNSDRGASSLRFWKISFFSTILIREWIHDFARECLLFNFDNGGNFSMVFHGEMSSSHSDKRVYFPWFWLRSIFSTILIRESLLHNFHECLHNFDSEYLFHNFVKAVTFPHFDGESILSMILN